MMKLVYMLAQYPNPRRVFFQLDDGRNLEYKPNGDSDDMRRRDDMRRQVIGAGATEAEADRFIELLHESDSTPDWDDEDCYWRNHAAFN